MIRNTDLLSIARSGVDASNRLLQTAGHNIANVNTEGYVRERTNFESQLYGGVGRATTERVINVFAQNQLRRDTTQLGEFETYYEKTTVLDNVLAGEANSIASSMSRYYASLQTASDDPTNLAARQLVLGEAKSMVGRINTMADFLADKEEELNLEMDAMVDKANTLIKSIAELNTAIRETQFNNRYDVPGSIMNERDNAIMELAELMSIETRGNANGDGTVLVNITSGESLVLQDGSFNAFQISDSPDLNYKSLVLTSNGKPTTLRLAETELGGSMGGLFRYRDEVLSSTQRELGQIAMSLAESMNSQNRVGMDFDQQLGGDIFALPEFRGLNYSANANPALSITGRVSEGGASTLTSADYQITIDAVTPGAPNTVDITVALLNPDGTPVNDTSGNPITQSYTGLDAVAGTFSSVLGGIEIEFPDTTNYTVGDQFLLQPSKNTASALEVKMTRPEDLAFALPFRVEADLNNFGDSKLVATQVTNTLVDNTLADPDTSAFDGAGGIQGPGAAPGGGVGAPAQILFTSATDYQVLDSAGTVITVVSGASNLNNILAQAATSGAGPAWPAAFSALNDYPGFDFSLQGVPQAGDSFNIAFNTDGLNDNRNALALANIQNKDSMLLNNNGGANLVSYHEAYSSIIGDIGGKAASADISLKAAEAMQQQSKDWFESVSGVSLDEEAANLVRFQQSYSAAARLLATAQELFNTILSSVR
jgi:flagellar hook-associated protein 1 FlgK